MKIISHRGNLTGKSDLENSLNYIDQALSRGFDVEIDVWYEDGELLLGHDEPTFFVTDIELFNDSRVWIHAKNLEALQYLCFYHPDSNFFWHQEDDYTLTSKNFIWTYPGKPIGKNSIIVSIDHENLDEILLSDAYGICTDKPIYVAERIESLKIEKKYSQYIEGCMIEEIEPISFNAFNEELDNGKCEVCLIFDSPNCECLK